MSADLVSDTDTKLSLNHFPEMTTLVCKSPLKSSTQPTTTLTLEVYMAEDTATQFDKASILAGEVKGVQSISLFLHYKPMRVLQSSLSPFLLEDKFSTLFYKMVWKQDERVLSSLSLYYDSTTQSARYGTDDSVLHKRASEMIYLHKPISTRICDQQSICVYTHRVDQILI